MASPKTQKSKGNPLIGSESQHAATMAELMAKMGTQAAPIKKGDIVEGIIKKLTPKEILLDISGKGDALVIEYDKKNLQNLLALLHVGDTVKASVISAESEEGFPVVSLRRMLDEMIYSGFEDANRNNAPLDVMISESTRGGYFAETSSGIQGFLPNSQVLEEKSLVGKTIQVKIIEFDKEKKRVIFSQKATVYTTDPNEITKVLRKGDIVEGVVSGVTPYGMYVLITPKEGIIIEGFIHISEISYERVENLNERFKKDDKIKTQVIDIDRENRRVNLSLKTLAKDPFAAIESQYKKEQKLKGKVTDVKTRGITLLLSEGVNGFIPGSKVPSETTYEVGQVIDVEVSEFDMKRRIIIVSPIMTTKFVGYR